MFCIGNPAPLKAPEELMTPGEHWSRDLAERVKWYSNTLGPSEPRLRQAAEDSGVPKQLVATAILNEMTEILDRGQEGILHYLEKLKKSDIEQDRLAASASHLALYAFNHETASLGIAQIQVRTAWEHRLLPLTAADFQEKGSSPRIPVWAAKAALARKLTIRECAILACARELRWQLQSLIRHQTGAWASQFGFTARSISVSDRLAIYGKISGLDQKNREKNFAEMVIAAYQSPKIAIAVTPGVHLGDDGDIRAEGAQPLYHNGRVWGQNARSVASDLFDANLFRDE